MAKLIWIIIGILLLIGALFFYSTLPQKVSNTTRSGFLTNSEIWSGEITITGDVFVPPHLSLTIVPGTKVRFLVQDNQQSGYETPADGYNDLDPTRLLSYGKTHSSLMVLGKLIAKGTPDNMILFTSAAQEPKLADWEAIYPQGDGSVIEYARIEWSRNGISPGDKSTPNSIFKNNIIAHTFWGAVSLGWSSAQAYNNTVYDCGHEGIDVQGGTPIIENNYIYNCHVGIVVLRGEPVVRNNVMKNVGGEIHIGGEATPVLENNTVELANPDTHMEWKYGDFAYVLWGEPIGTPIFTEVYRINDQPRYAISGYKLKELDYTVKLPIEADEWSIWLYKDGGWHTMIGLSHGPNATISRTLKFGLYHQGYSLYLFIPDPTENEKEVSWLKKTHPDIPKIMAV